MKTNFPSVWQEMLEKAGFDSLTDIQQQAFEPIFTGKDLLALSPTGTGKTLAYLWPSLLALTPKKSQQLLILAPNTELAGQIFEVCKGWSEAIGLQAQLFLPGSSQKRQIERLKKGPEILIGTPGRVFELIKLKKIKMMNIKQVIKLKANVMLNGYLQKIRLLIYTLIKLKYLVMELNLLVYLRIQKKDMNLKLNC